MIIYNEQSDQFVISEIHSINCAIGKLSDAIFFAENFY